jgi:hypothetical protein
MNTHRYMTRFQLKAAPMTTGLVLLGTGALMGIAGMIVGGTAVFSATRQWWRHMAVKAAEDAQPSWGRQFRDAMSSGPHPMSGSSTYARSMYARSGR